jgi:hypothetical protein
LIGIATLCLAIISAVLFPPTARAQYQEDLLYRFTGGSDGAYPQASLVIDPKGDLYGTTPDGGTGGNGVVFRLYRTTNNRMSGRPIPQGSEYYPQDTWSGRTGPWSKSVLHSFTGGSDGGYPAGSLTFDSEGNLYGTALHGGNTSACGGYGCGVVFELSPPEDSTAEWTQTVLHAFAGADGANPVARDHRF